MKLLFDENLSPRLAMRLLDLFPASTHVWEVGLWAANDPLVWEYARLNGFLIVSKDADMHDLSLLFGNPPKVIWLRLGNYDKSIEDYQAALAMQPKQVWSLYGLGLAELKKGRTDQANTSLQKAQSLDATIAGRFKEIGLAP